MKRLIFTDIDCKVYIDGTMHGSTKAGEEYEILLQDGTHEIECVSTEEKKDRTALTIATDNTSETEKIEVLLKPIRYARLVAQYDEIGEFHCGYAAAMKNGKIRCFINRDGEWAYEDAAPFGSNLCVVDNENYLWGIIDETGEYKVEPTYTSLEPISDTLAIFSQDYKYGLLSIDGEILIETKYNKLNHISGADMLKFSTGGKYGILDYAGKEIISPKYDLISPYNEGIATVLLDNKYGIVDMDGKELTPLKYDTIGNFHNGIAYAKIGDLYGFINKTGREITPIKYNSITIMTGVAIKVEVGGKWGIIDFEGNELTPIKYDNITAVVKSEKATSDYTSTDLKKVLLVEIDNLKGLVNATGKEITACIYERIYHLENDLAMICQKNKFGVVDMCTGKVLVAPKYHFISQYGKGIYNVELKDKHGIIDSYGKLLVPCIYDELDRDAFYTRNEIPPLIGVCKDKKWGFVDLKGNLVVDFQYAEIVPFVCGRAAVRRGKGKWGYIDEMGKEIVSREYKFVSDFGYANNNKAYAYVSINDDYDFFYIDAFGNKISDKIYYHAQHFDSETGLAEIQTMEHKCGFIDTTGNEVIPPVYDSVKSFQNGLCCVLLGGKYGYIDTTGKMVIPCIYDMVGNLGFFDDRGLVDVTMGKEHFYINRKGEAVKP